MPAIPDKPRPDGALGGCLIMLIVLGIPALIFVWTIIDCILHGPLVHITPAR